MEIIYKNKRNIPFKMVAIGEVFSWNGILYMTIPEGTSTSTGELFNAVSMKDGEIIYFDSNAEVFIVKAQLVIS